MISLAVGAWLTVAAVSTDPTLTMKERLDTVIESARNFASIAPNEPLHIAVAPPQLPEIVLDYYWEKKAPMVTILFPVVIGSSDDPSTKREIYFVKCSDKGAQGIVSTKTCVLRSAKGGKLPKRFRPSDEAFMRLYAQTLETLSVALSPPKREPEPE